MLHVNQNQQQIKLQIQILPIRESMKFLSAWRLKQLGNKRAVTYHCSVRCTKTSSSSAIYKIPHSCKLLSQKSEKKSCDW